MFYDVYWSAFLAFFFWWCCWKMFWQRKKCHLWANINDKWLGYILLQTLFLSLIHTSTNSFIIMTWKCIKRTNKRNQKSRLNYIPSYEKILEESLFFCKLGFRFSLPLKGPQTKFCFHEKLNHHTRQWNQLKS